MPGLSLHAKRRIVQGDHRLQARQSLARFVQIATQIAYLARQAADESAIEASICILQYKRRLTEPADQTPSKDVRTPADGMPATLHVDPLVDKRTRIGASDSGIRSSQMPQPDKAQQRRGPLVRWWCHFKGRPAVANDDFAGESKMPSVNFAGAGCIGGAQILRRNQQTVGFG